MKAKCFVHEEQHTETDRRRQQSFQSWPIPHWTVSDPLYDTQQAAVLSHAHWWRNINLIFFFLESHCTLLLEHTCTYSGRCLIHTRWAVIDFSWCPRSCLNVVLGLVMCAVEQLFFKDLSKSVSEFLKFGLRLLQLRARPWHDATTPYFTVTVPLAKWWTSTVFYSETAHV